MIGKNQQSLTNHQSRLAYLITDAKLQIYIEKGFTAPQIATMLSVSKSTIRRRLCKFGISIIVNC